MDKKTTPGKRVENKSGTPHSAKTRTWTTAPAKRRCLIENIDSCNALEYAHLVPQATRDPGLLDKLECSWGMERGTFNVHTRYNLCLLGAKFHSLFDKGNWLLLPDNDTLALFTFGTVFPQYKPGDVFNYEFVPLRKMDSVPIHLQINQDPPISPASFRTIVHPFDDLPIIRSHLRPHFVIYNAALKLVDNAEYQNQYPTLANSFKKILATYLHWTAPPTEEFLNSMIAPPAPSEEEESDACSSVTGLSVQSTQTAAGRVSGSKKRSRHGDNQDEMDLNEETPTKKSRSVKSGGILGVPQLAYDTAIGESL